MPRERGIDLGIYTLEEVVKKYIANGRSLERTAMAVPFSAMTLSRLLHEQAPEVLQTPGRPAIDQETINEIDRLVKEGKGPIAQVAFAHGTSEKTYHRRKPR